MSPQAEAVAGRLRATWESWWTYTLLTGLSLTLAISAAALLVSIALDAWLGLPQGGRLVLSGLWALATAGMLGHLIWRLLRYRRTLSATARRVEAAFPELGSHLINLVQLSQSHLADETDPAAAEANQGKETSSSRAWRRAAVEQAARAVGDCPFEQAAERESRWRRFVLCMQTRRDLLEALGALGTVLVVGLVLSLVVPAWGNATRRLLHPWSFIPTVGAVAIAEVAPGNAEVRLGDRTAVTVRLARPTVAAPAADGSKPATSATRGTLFVRQPGARQEATIPLVADAAGLVYAATLPPAAGPVEYRVEVGGTQSERFTLGIYRPPRVESVVVTYRFPAYLGLPEKTVTQKDGDLEAPQYSEAHLSIVPTVPVAQGYVVQASVEGKQYGRLVDDGRAFEAVLGLNQPATYTIHPVTAAGHTDESPRVNQVKVLADAPPVVELIEPRPAGADVGTKARSESEAGGVAAGSRLEIVLRASDDHGLGSARVEVRSGAGAATGEEGGAGPGVETVASWETFAGEGWSAQLHHTLVLDPAKYVPGAPLAVRAVVTDRREVKRPKLELGPQEMATAWVDVRVVDPQQKAAESLARLEDLRSAIGRLLQQQTRARVQAVGVARQADLAAAKKAALEVRSQQVAIQKGTTDLAETAAPTDTEVDALMRRTLGKLAADDLILAVDQAEALGQSPGLEGLAEPAATLMATQDRAIAVYRALLNELRKENADLLTEMGRRPDTTVPPDVEDRLRALRDKLDEFLKQQKKIIEASERLAKKPVDNFTEEDQKALEALAAAEDEWSRFMKDTHTDLSKLPEQDFSNPSLLQELIEVETEIKMAKDALTQKTVDIAVPLEQLGAEMAKEMTTNIEKWLTDTPDRERWSQEEPLTDEMKEAPMAELPQELEDLVGELMEEEEDLFDEMEDITSSWADSLDKGAGWDAMDGPISNMSARGVTGNRLPNTSEIGGRSGEGRSGKSSGEFVGDSAEGKGGRKTPTRLTPDPFVKGQVNDTSKDPMGGATGGGKTSGYGGEGLQGPLSGRPENPLARLASKQAELRNKAEAVDLKFQVLRFHHTDLKALIQQMTAVEQDLNAGLYENALRRRDVMLDGLGQLKQYLSGEFVIRQDTTANLPTEIQKEILGNMSEPSPAGWDELNRRYFERLSAGTTPGSALASPSAAPATEEETPAAEAP